MSQGPWAVKIADIFQVSGDSRALGRIEVASLCGLTAGPWLPPCPKAGGKISERKNRESPAQLRVRGATRNRIRSKLGLAVQSSAGPFALRATRQSKAQPGRSKLGRMYVRTSRRATVSASVRPFPEVVRQRCPKPRPARSDACRPVAHGAGAQSRQSPK